MCPLSRRAYILDVASEMEQVDGGYTLWFRRVLWDQPLKFENELYVTMHYNQVSAGRSEALELSGLPRALAFEAFMIRAPRRLLPAGSAFLSLRRGRPNGTASGGLSVLLPLALLLRCALGLSLAERLCLALSFSWCCPSPLRLGRLSQGRGVITKPGSSSCADTCGCAWTESACFSGAGAAAATVPSPNPATGLLCLRVSQRQPEDLWKWDPRSCMLQAGASASRGPVASRPQPSQLTVMCHSSQKPREVTGHPPPEVSGAGTTQCLCLRLPSCLPSAWPPADPHLPHPVPRRCCPTT